MLKTIQVIVLVLYKNRFKEVVILKNAMIMFL